MTITVDPPVAVAPAVELDVVDCSDPLGLLHRLDVALQSHPQELVIDLSGCGACDADTVRVLLDVHCAAVRDGAALVLRRPSEPVLQAIVQSGLQGVFSVQAGAPDQRQGDLSAA